METEAIDSFIHMMCAIESHGQTITAERNTPAPEITELNPLKRVLMEMLTESTGCDILDSGMSNGRHWQKNRVRDFNSEPSSTLDVSSDDDGKVTEFYVIHNVFHWLYEKLEIPDDADVVLKAWNDMRNDPEYTDEGWFTMMEDFHKYFGEHVIDDSDYDDFGLTGMYGDGSPISVNTYNGEDCLSQVLQYEYFSYDDTEYVLLQIHNGADVRGGYTEPKLFLLSDELSIFRNADADLGCSNKECDAAWYTDDSWNWYSNSTEPDLKEHDLRSDEKTGNRIVCPVCKKGVLEPGFC